MSLRILLAMVPAPVLVALGLILFYEGVPIPQWFRAIPVAGPVAEALIDGRVDRAARAATAGLVARAELDAERIRRHASDLARERAKARADELEAINADYFASLGNAYSELEAANAELDDLAAAAVDAACSVDPGLLGRLRNE